MATNFLLYGANGFVGSAAARAAVERGYRPILAGRNAAALAPLAKELGLEFRAFALDDRTGLDGTLRETGLVFHCAGPYIHTASPMAEACLRTGAHYLDLTGEIPVYAALAALDERARARGVMLLPGAGFDVVPTDCLALHLKRRLPSANRLTIAFRGRGPAGLPPGTQRTAIELVPFGDRIRSEGVLVEPARSGRIRTVDFGDGPVEVTRLTWGDVFTAFYSTGIPNIETYAAIPAAARRAMAVTRLIRPLFRFRAVREFLQARVRPGPDERRRARSSTDVWARVEDPEGRTATGRVHGPEAGVVWTVEAALAIVARVLGGSTPPGFQTPARAYGPDLVLDCEGVTRVDVD